MDGFYDQLAPLYHLIYDNWDASIALQGKQLSAIIHSYCPGASRVLDVSCGIGTQSIGLALNGFSVTGSDLSSAAIERAKREASLRGVQIQFSVADMQSALAHHGNGFDVVIAADNAVPHLLSDDEILAALGQIHACLRPGGCCVISVRDYAAEERGKNIIKRYGIRQENGKRYVLFHVWDFESERCEFTLFIVEENLQTRQVRTHAMRSVCYPISIDRLIQLMQKAGFAEVRRIDGGFYQPVLVGIRR